MEINKTTITKLQDYKRIKQIGELINLLLRELAYLDINNLKISKIDLRRQLINFNIELEKYKLLNKEEISTYKINDINDLLTFYNIIKN